jgi:hypothetical protein
MNQSSIARALRQLREDRHLTREDVVTSLANRNRKRSLTAVRSWETKGSIKLDDAFVLVEQILATKWSDFEMMVAHQEELATPKPKRPRKPKGSAGSAATGAPKAASPA